MTQDLTKITMPFGLLDAETAEALQAHGGPYEMFGYSGWEDINPNWIRHLVYRVKPTPPHTTIVPDEVCRVLPKKYRWAATEHSGAIYVYENKPKLNDYGHRLSGAILWKFPDSSASNPPPATGKKASLIARRDCDGHPYCI